MNEFNLLSQAEKIAWCRSRLEHFAEVEAQLPREPPSTEVEEGLEAVVEAQAVLRETLHTFEDPTLRQRINSAVNRSAARRAVRDDAKRRPKRSQCVLCRGSGRRVSDAGGSWVDCECGGRPHHEPPDPEIEAARRRADELRSQIRRH